MIDTITTLDGYMQAYGELLGQQAQLASQPLHVPGRDATWQSDTIRRKPFEAQAHVITAAAKALDRQKSLMIVGEMGTGKTIMGMCSAHAHARGKPYRALVFCPGQLVGKWEREIRETIRNVDVFRIKSFHDLCGMTDLGKPTRPTWWIISRNRAKMSAKWRPAYMRLPYAKGLNLGRGIMRCCECFEPVLDKDGNPIGYDKLSKKKTFCEHCDAPLWTYTHKIDRWEPAKYIHKKLPHFFDYLLVDEVHEEKGANTAQGNACGTLAAAAKKVIPLTGTLIGGYAEHLRPLLFRLAPGSLVQEGLSWEDSMPFNERYGRIETRIVEKSGTGDSNNQSRGSKTQKTKYIRPGIMPGLFGKHLIDKAVFLGLDEVASNLPPYKEIVEAVDLDEEQQEAYQHVEERLRAEISGMVQRGDKRLLGTMLRTLLGYPDHPYGWKKIGYHNRDGRYVTVVEPEELDKKTIRPKEQRLLDIIKAERAAGRQCWVYFQMTDKLDCLARLEKLIKAEGHAVKVLRANDVELEHREQWIAEHGKGADVVLSHPKLVETGLDLFCKAGNHNFCTLIFYQTGYALFTLRQASRRAWRIGQTKTCKVIYLYYKQTMQEQAMKLMGKKMSASQAIEGKFSAEGLAAMGGEDGSVELALAKSLSERLDGVDISRAWGRIGELGYQAGQFNDEIDLPFQSIDVEESDTDDDQLPADDDVGGKVFSAVRSEITPAIAATLDKIESRTLFDDGRPERRPRRRENHLFP